jgi:hypothetical protein
MRITTIDLLVMIFLKNIRRMNQSATYLWAWGIATFAIVRLMLRLEIRRIFAVERAANIQ